MNTYICKFLFFSIHAIIIILSLFGPILNKKLFLLPFIVIISWLFNHNKCILTLIEDKLFDETIIDIFFKNKRSYDKNILYEKKYIVPKFHRYILYLLFIIEIYYYLL